MLSKGESKTALLLQSFLFLALCNKIDDCLMPKDIVYE